MFKTSEVLAVVEPLKGVKLSPNEPVSGPVIVDGQCKKYLINDASVYVAPNP